MIRAVVIVILSGTEWPEANPHVSRAPSGKFPMALCFNLGRDVGFACKTPRGVPHSQWA